MPQYDSLIEAANLNASIICDHLEGGAVATLGDIKRVCAANGYADDVSVDIALRQVVEGGLVIKQTVHGLTTYIKGA